MAIDTYYDFSSDTFVPTDLSTIPEEPFLSDRSRSSFRSSLATALSIESTQEEPSSCCNCCLWNRLKSCAYAITGCFGSIFGKIADIARRIFYGKYSLRYLIPNKKVIKKTRTLTSYVELKEGWFSKPIRLFFGKTLGSFWMGGKDPLTALSFDIKPNKEGTRADLLFCYYHNNDRPEYEKTFTNLPIHKEIFHLSHLFPEKIIKIGVAPQQYLLLEEVGAEIKLCFSLPQGINQTSLPPYRTDKYEIHFELFRNAQDSSPFQEEKALLSMKVYSRKDLSQPIYKKDFFDLTICCE